MKRLIKTNIDKFNNRLSCFIDSNYKKILIFFIISFFILYLVLIFGDNIWSDESYTIALIKHNFNEIWNITAADVHPPLYYFLMKICTCLFNYNTIVLRIFSIIPYMFVLVYGGQQVNKYFGKEVSLLFIVLFFCFPYAIRYSVEIRMYSYATAFVFGNALFAYKAYKEPKISNWIWFILFGVLAAYTHYFALVSVCVTYALLLISLIKTKKRIRYLIISIFISLLLYLPWMSSFLSQIVYKVNNPYWIEAITLNTIVSYIKTMFGISHVPLYHYVLFGSYIFMFIYAIYKKNQIIPILCFLVFFLTVVLGVTVSILVKPIFIIRYVVPTIPLLVLFMSIMLNELKNKTVVYFIVLISIIGGVLSYGASIYNVIFERNYMQLDKCQEVECYVSVDNTSNGSNTLAYYVPDKIIFGKNNITYDASPWINRKEIDEFNIDNYNCFAFLNFNDDKIPDEYLKEFDAEYIGDWKIQKFTARVYILNRKK